ncbi:MAG: ABC transporter substrate binding protein [Pseudomonadota bacterium]
MTTWWGALLLLIVPIAAAAASPAVPRVLLICSYSPAFPTFYNQVDGVKAVLDGRGAVLDVEFMDVKRFPDSTSLELFAALLARKLARLDKYDAVITADDSALEFVLARRNKLFQDVPVVFLGVNNLDLALGLQSDPWVTGVVEAVSMRDTLALMLKLQPGVREIIALVDGTNSGQGDLKTFHEAGREFAGIKFSDLSLAELSLDEFTGRLRTIGPDRAVLLLSAYNDKNGRTLTFRDSLKLIRENLSRPIFHLWRHGIGEGALGGKVISHFEQGRAAAMMVRRVLEGENIKKMPIIATSPNIYIFDFQELRRFEIKPAALPEGSLILNQPVTIYSEYKTIFWSGLFVFIFLSTLTTILAVNIARRGKAEAELSRERLFFENILNASTDTYYIFDLEQGTPRRWNRALGRITGYDDEEIARMTRYDFFPPEYHDVLDERKKSIMRGERRTDEIPLLKKDGGTVFFEFQSFAIKGPDGKQTLAASIGRDVSERKKNEEALRKSEERFREFIEGAEDIVTRVDARGDYLYISPAGARIAGYPPEEIIGRSAFEFIHPDDRAETRRAFLEWLENGTQAAVLENRMLNCNGRVHNLLWSIRLYYDQQGELTGINSIARDITELRRTEAQLTWESKVNAALAELGEALLGASSPDRIAALFLEKVQLLTGATTCFSLHMDPTDGRRVYHAFPRGPGGPGQAGLNAEAFFDFLDRLDRPGRQKRAFFVNSPFEEYPDRDAPAGLQRFLSAPALIGDQPAGRLAAVNPDRDFNSKDLDLMERLALIFALALQKQWTSEALERALERVEAANRAKSAFLANISHELRTPLNPVIGLTELVLESPELVGENRVFLTHVRDSAGSLLAMINDLIELSRLEGLDEAPRCQLFSLKAVVEAVAARVSRDARKKNLTIAVDISPEIPDLLTGDSRLLEALLEKIGGNAVKFTEQGEVSLVFTKKVEDHNQVLVECRVSDPGIGIPPDRLKQLFDDFTQADGSTTRRFGGLGLGLTMSRRIVKLLGGTIRAESEIGRGSRFIMEIPLRKQRPED